MKYILLPLVYICLLPIYFMLRNETKPKKNIILGVTLPYEARQDETVLAICADFRRRLNVAVLLLAALPLLMLPIALTSVFMTCLFMWLIAAVVVPYIPYVKCHKRLRAYKREAYPPPANAGETLVDLRSAALPKKSLHPLWFLPPLVMALVPVAHTLFTAAESEALPFMLLGYGVNFFIVLLFCGLYRLINRQRAEVVDDNATLTAALTQVRRYQWGRAWAAFSWLTGLFSLGLWLFIDLPFGVLLLALGYTAVLIAVCIRTEFAARRAQESLTAQSGQGFYADDDRYWLWGMVYYNPNDKHLNINNRVGIGMTMNLAHWAGKLIMGISVLVLLAMPFLGAWLIHQETTPVTLTLEGTELVAAHTSEICRLDVADIRRVALLDALPNTTRLVGTEFDTYFEGTFTVEGYGKCTLCLNPQAPPFLLIETEEETWLLGMKDESAIKTIYAQLAGR